MGDIASIVAEHALISDDLGLACDCCHSLTFRSEEDWAAHVSDAITEARTIRTVEQLDALPPLSVVREIRPRQHNGRVFERWHDDLSQPEPQRPWCSERRFHPSTGVDLPVLLLWSPAVPS